MKVQKLKEDIETLKKYHILKTNRKKIDDVLKEIEKLSSELYEKQNNYKKIVDTNYFIKDKLSISETELKKYNKLTKIINYYKYKKVKEDNKELLQEVTEALAKEETQKLEIDLLEKKIKSILDDLSRLCGFPFTKEYYSSFLEEFRDKQYYNTNLIELINKKEEELKKYEENE